MKDNTGTEICGIQFTLDTDESGNAYATIFDKGYHDNRFEGRGLMKLGFSILAESFKNLGIKYVIGYITGEESAITSRTHAPKLFSQGQTYEFDSHLEKRPYRYRRDELATVLVTNLQ